MRTRLLGAVAVTAVALAACAGPAAAPGPEDVLFLRAAGGITLVRDLPQGEAASLRRAVPSTDWTAVVQASRNGSRTRVVAVDSPTGAQLWSREVPGRLEVKVASQHGRLVALGSPRDGSIGYPVGRSTTTLVLVGPDMPEPRTIILDGNFQPEAFSTDGQSLFVVEYLPAENPRRYQVRRLDIPTEQVVGVYSVDAHLQQAMQGTARIQASSRDGRRLYTLYTLDVGGSQHAFIHVLSLDELWAHCIDLPPEFGMARERDIALSVAPDGHRLYVADAATGMVADVDTQGLTVARTTQAELGSDGGTTHAATGPDGTVYLSKGARFVSLDGATLAPTGSWDMGQRISGLQTAHDGGRVYVGLQDEVVIVDTQTGDTVGSIDPEDIGTIDQLGESTHVLNEVRQTFECAC